MTKTELHTALNKEINTYFMWAPKGTKTPYAVYTWDNIPNVSADDSVYQKAAAVTIMCYFTSTSLLNVLDATLDELVGFYASSVEYDTDAECYIQTYTMEVIDNA